MYFTNAHFHSDGFAEPSFFCAYAAAQKTCEPYSRKCIQFTQQVMHTCPLKILHCTQLPHSGTVTPHIAQTGFSSLISSLLSR